ncbi:MAG: addiction module protein [bacterium]|nr:addiction module protein [bacterium]
MASKANFILNEALSMSSAERATIAHCLISSLDQPKNENVDAEWIKLAQKRLADLENSRIEPVSWDTIKQKARE